MDTIFPFIQPDNKEKKTLPLYRDIKWDFARDTPMFRSGNPVIAYGLEAVKTWAYCALRTTRFRHIIYTHNYGNEIESLIGKPFSTSVKTAEAKRYIEECLTVSPYIRSVTDISVAFSDGKLSIDCSINTVYGREGVKINV